MTQIATAGSFEERTEEAVLIRGIHLIRIRFVSSHGIHIEQPSLWFLGQRFGQENVPGIQVGMEKAVLGADFKKVTDGGKSPGTVSRFWAGRKERGKITAFRDKGCDDINPEKKSGWIK
jgi:hypothetical protein